MFWYVLFVKTGREEKIELCLKEQLNTEVFMPFVPILEVLVKISGKVRKEFKPLFPGYVFIESEVSSLEFLTNIRCIFSLSQDIIRVLNYGEPSHTAMKECERGFLLELCNEEHCVESSFGIKEGNQIHITDGPLKGQESIVKKVNRHKRKAWIEMIFMGEMRLVCVSLEVMEKVG